MLFLLRLALDNVTYYAENDISESAQDSFLVSHFQNENTNIVFNIAWNVGKEECVYKNLLFVRILPPRRTEVHISRGHFLGLR